GLSTSPRRARTARGVKPGCRRPGAPRGRPRSRPPSSSELHLVPGRDGGELEQRPTSARVAVAEVGRLLVPRDVEQPLLDAMVEPGAAEHELLQPVDERLAADERHALPVADEV